MALKHLLKALVPPRARRYLRDRFVAFNVRHFAGLKVVRLAPDEAAVTCLVKNGEYYLRAFIDHHLRQGFRHIFILDNGSSDETVQIAAAHPNVSVFQTSLDVGMYQGNLKRHLAQRTVKGGWCLDVDIDEFFDYPYSHVVPLKRFLRYLNSNHFTVVINQMLDLYSENTLSHLLVTVDEDIHSVYRFFDLSEVERVLYRKSTLTPKYGNRNTVTDPGLELLYGGIRKRLYGINCLLTKHSLFKRSDDLDLFPHVHFVDGGHLADVTGVLLHYKMTSNALDLAKQNEAAFSANRQGYSDFISAVLDKRETTLMRPETKEFESAHALLETGFLRASHHYMDLVASPESDELGPKPNE